MQRQLTDMRSLGTTPSTEQLKAIKKEVKTCTDALNKTIKAIKKADLKDAKKKECKAFGADFCGTTSATFKTFYEGAKEATQKTYKAAAAKKKKGCAKFVKDNAKCPVECDKIASTSSLKLAVLLALTTAAFIFN